MYRHSRHVYTPELEMLPVGRAERFPDRLLYKAVSGEVSPSGTGISVSSESILETSPAYELSSGRISAGNLSLENTWSISAWVLTEPFHNAPLVSIWSGSQRLFELNVSLAALSVYSDLTDDEYFQKTILVNLVEGQWNLFHIERVDSTLKVYVNLIEVYSNPFFYGPLKGDVYYGFGASGMSSQSLDGLYIYNTATLPYVASLDDYKYKSTRVDERIVASIGVQSEASCVHPTSSYTSTSKSWIVQPEQIISGVRSGGLDLIQGTDTAHPLNYTISLVFKDLGTVTRDSAVLSNDNFVLYKRASDGKYVYRGQSRIVSGTYEEYPLPGVAVENGTNCIYISSQSSLTAESITLRLNDNAEESDTLDTLASANFAYRFNSNRLGVLPATAPLTVYSFVLYDSVSPEGIAYPYPVNSKATRYLDDVYRPHMSEYALTSPSASISAYDFTVSVSSASIIPGGNLTITVTQGAASIPIVYTYSVLRTRYEGPSSDIAIVNATRTITAAATSVTNTVTLFNYSTNPFNVYFDIEVSNKYVRKVVRVPVLDAREYDVGAYTFHNSRLLQGLTTSNSGIGLSGNTNSFASSGTNIVSKVDSFASEVGGSSGSFSLANAVSGVRTFLMAYREYRTVNRRPYFGNSSAYVFNGGVSGQLLGALELIEGQYATAYASSGRIQSLQVSRDDSTAALADEVGKVVYVYYRDIFNNWVTTPISLDTGLTGSSWVQGVSLDVSTTGEYIALGVKNANSGEGFVQVWRRTGTGVYSKDLQLSSPVPQVNLGGFGATVAINDAGNRLAVSEPGSGKTYLYSKPSIWSATPIQTITESSGYAYKLRMKADASALYILNTSKRELYTYGTVPGSYTLSNTLTNVDEFDVDKVSGRIISSNYATNAVTLHTSSPVVFSGGANHGYSVSIYEDSAIRICITDPNADKIKVYTSLDNYAVASEIVGLDGLGYSVSLAAESILVSDYNTTALLYTKDTASLGQVVNSVRLNGTEVNGLTTAMPKESINVVAFRTSSALAVNRIGTNRVGRFLDGYLKGFVLYSTRLTDVEIAAEEVKLKRWLKIQEFSLYDL